MIKELKKTVSHFPDLPGVYLLKDKHDKIIYVGKAQSLRNRVRSYLTESPAALPRLKSLQEKLTAIEYIVTDSEVEALILECSLIKEYRPRFNVNLKDDKDYPYMLITPEKYPRLELLRLSQKSGKRGRYIAVPGKKEIRYGPYTDVGSIRETMQFLGTIFPLRRCRQPLDGTPASTRPCLNFQMKRCIAPCRGEDYVSAEEYDNIVRQVMLFLDGRFSDLEQKLKQQMEQAAERQNFEEAAVIRDRLKSLQQVAGYRQKVLLSEKSVDRDIIALSRLGKQSAVTLFQIRGGKLLNRDYFNLTGTVDVEDREVITAFIKSYYSRVDKIPSEIILSVQPADSEILGQWFGNKAKRKVTLKIPVRGGLKKLVELAERNCLLRLEEEEERRMTRIDKPLQDLQELLSLKEPPGRIEAYDISHLRGEETVGAMVVFNNGESSSDDYRFFNIRSAPAGDDYASLREVLLRRVKQNHWQKPDLVLIDGGRGQLSTIKEILQDTIFSDVPLLALAKNPDQLFVENSKQPVLLSADNAMLKLLQRIRNEVHRFAISGHRRRKNRRNIRSVLENIPGVGPVKRKALLEYFGSQERIIQASTEDLQKVPGINHSLAENIFRFFHNRQLQDI
ncbi:MAG: excinuclease ABC subunit UvrC [Bacillota bacterium]|nr:excinuclease ABC subunit UvrC [Bacillota bacterium]